MVKAKPVNNHACPFKKEKRKEKEREEGRRGSWDRAYHTYGTRRNRTRFR